MPMHLAKGANSGWQVYMGQMKLELKATLMAMLQHMPYAMHSLPQLDSEILEVILEHRGRSMREHLESSY